MKLKHLAIILLASVAFAACKTTEANYRAAYEKARAAADDSDDIESTIYGTQRRQMGHSAVATAKGDTVDVATHIVRITEGGGGMNENLHRYNVVVAQFKQKFNAVSYRNRLVDNGAPAAFVVETAEPYYYVVLSSFDTVDAAADALDKYSSHPIIAPKEPCPFVLDATARRRPRK